MGLEQIVNQQLNKYPKVKKVIKRAYQRTMYAVSPKIKSEGNIVRVSPDDPNHEYFFGYYDKSPWDATDRYMLCLKAKDTWSDVSPKETADILLIDTEKATDDPSRYKKIAETRSWNVQQSCMLQWLGPDYSSKIIYNDFRDGRYVSVILSVEDGSEKVIEAPVYTVSNDGKTALTLDFSRLYNLRPGYGYYNVPEKTKGVALPDTTAVWKINLETGEVQDLLKYADFASFQPRHEMEEKGSVHKVNHLMISPNGKRFMVLYRWFNGQRKYTRLITCNVDGTDMYVLSDDDMVSHCCWMNNSSILAFENKKETGSGYYLMKDKTQKYVQYWKGIDFDGHPSFSPDGSHIVFDRYPDKARVAAVFVSDAKDRKKKDVQVVARVFAPFKYDNDTRCDLHPRWNREGTQICFDSVFEGHRGLYTVEVPKENSNQSSDPARAVNEINLRSEATIRRGCEQHEQPDRCKLVKVLYITDNLKQRYGVSAVMMNYFRHINKDEVHIDFLCWQDGNDEELIDEIETSGSIVYGMPRLGYKNFFEVRHFYEEFFKEHGKEYLIVHSHFCEMDEIIFPIAKKYGVKTCISHSHNTKFSEYKLRAIRNQLMCLNIDKVADVWAACSTEAGISLYGRNFAKSEKSLLIHNAIDTGRFKFNPEIRKRVRTDLGISDDVVVLGNVGSLKPQKNQIFLMDVMKALKDRDSKHTYLLIIAGEGGLHKELAEKAKMYGISENVKLLGLRNDVPELLQAMDIFVLPSLYEGLPVGGVEAQAAGLPCLFSDTITREVDIVHENCMYLQNNDTDKWIKAIRTLNFAVRMDVTNIIQDAGYDIVTESNTLARKYFKMGNK